LFGLQPPFLVGEFAQLLLVGEGLKVPHHGRLAGKSKVALNLAGRGRQVVLQLKLPDEFEDLFLSFG